MVETLLEGLKTAAATFATFNPETLNRVEDMFRLA